MDLDALEALAGIAVKVWLLLVVLGLPAQALLQLATLSAQRSRRIVAVVGAVAIIIVSALITDVVFYPYDGNLAHTLVLWVTLSAFSVPAHLLLFLALFRSKSLLPKVAEFAGGVGMMMLGVAAFWLRTFAYGLQHSLGGWP